MTFSLIFIAEMILKLCAFGVKEYVKEPFNIIDGIIAVMSIIQLSNYFNNKLYLT